MSLTPKLLQQGAAGSARPVYIEDVFSAFLYTGNGTTKNITNGIDLSTKGGLVWTKSRSNAQNNYLADTVASQYLISNTTSGSQGSAFQGSNDITSATTTGYTLGPNSSTVVNSSGQTQVSWTFRKQRKFFDIVTYTGNGATYQDVTHSLGSTPGCIMVKCTSTGSTNWMVVHRSLAVVNQNLILNSTASASTVNSETITWGSVDGSYNGFFRVLNSLGSSDPNNYLNVNGNTYVAYLFAHNAGGFGPSASDNVITCGSFTTDGSGNFSVNLGYEPQWVLAKATNEAGSDWYVWDTMRGWPARNSTSVNYVNSRYLSPNTSTAEADFGGPYVTNTGFGGVLVSSITYIYIAIRRGPMKVPTTGTSVFVAETYNGTNTLNREFDVSPLQYSDLSWFISRNYPTAPVSISFVDRLRGSLAKLWTGGTSNESTSQASVSFSNKMEAIVIGTTGNFSGLNETGTSFVMYNLKRAPGFFDEVCYTGNYAGNPQIPHNLTVAPELIIAKVRSTTGAWYINSPLIGTNFQLAFNASAKSAGSTYTLTSTYFQNPDINYPTGETFVAYLFATCAGVSKVGSYTGNGSSQTIDCGFASGARFVLIKRTDSSGDWYTFDTARGIVSGNDPFLKLNTTDAEATAYDAVDPANSGFIVNNDATNFPINVASATYIFLAIA